MDWSDAILLLLVLAILVLYLRLARRTRRLRQLADEANRLRHEAQATEQRNRQLKQEMTSNIAHELKTPVSSIRGYLEILLSDRPIDDDRRRHFLERSYQQTLRLSDLIQDVSVINKLEESADLFPLEQLDVRDVAQEVFDELADRAASASVTLRNNLPPLPIRGNHELLYRIFRNLADNALSYAGPGIDIVAETYEPVNSKFKIQNSEFHYIHFYDTGRGVPDDYLARLFDRFVRIGQGRSRADGGTGLGLSIVKHAVLFHHGEIYAKNRIPGLEFYFSLRRSEK